MKILMITPYLPYPIVSGGQIRTFNLLKQLSSKHEITLLSFIRENSEQQYVQELSKYCHKVITFNRTPKAWHLRNIFLAGITAYPFVVSLYLYKSLTKAISDELESNNYDLIHAETFYVMPNIPKTSIPILLVEQVIEYLVYQRFTEMLSGIKNILKPLMAIDVFKIKWWERYYWRKANGLAAMSDEDRDFMLNLEPNLKIDVIANGVDINYFANTTKFKSKNPTVLFIGNFKWLPNKDAVKYLVIEIWPKILAQIPNAKLKIIGRNPTQDIWQFNNQNGVIVDDGVEDIRTAYSTADVLLAPIRNGRGTKYKILEAMATKTPIVGTQLAVEGVDIKPNKHALVGETSEELALHTITILKNPQLGKKLSQEAYKLVSQSYSWDSIANQLDQLYHKLASK